jgi:5-methylcytosine-specific restriction enzyme subunit McrC
MMRYVPGFNPRKSRSPTPRPDFAVRDGRNVKALLDAKYRDLWARDLPRDMLYQLAMYALSQPKGATAAILFPTTSPEARDAIIEIREPLGDGSLGFVALRPVIVEELVEAITGNRDARKLAAHYAFGTS